jgi:DNA-directed RNA polymerase specialized sigma24 family protein
MDFFGGPLSNFYQLYTAGNMTERELENSVFEYILGSYNNEYGLYFRDRVERADFLCRIYPKIRNAIKRYDSGHASFDTYVATTVRYAYRFYRAKDKRRHATEHACWNVCDDYSVQECEAPYQDEETVPDTYGKTLPKHALLLLLKSFYYISDDMVNKAARTLGMDAKVLGGMIDTLHSLQLKKITRLQKLANSAHCLYFRCLSYEWQLADRHGNPQTRALIERRLKRGRRHLEDIRSRLKSTRIEATNGNLAKLLGIPKGTIDTRLATIRSRLSGNEYDL